MILNPEARGNAKRIELGHSSSGKSPFLLRRAFTLIELMVVVVIIGIIASATTVVVVRVIESQRRASTKLLLDTINNALSAQASKLVDQTRRAGNADSIGDTDLFIESEILKNWRTVFVGSIQGSNGVYGAKDVPGYLAQIKGFGLSLPVDFSGMSLPSGAVVDPNGKTGPKPEEFESSFVLYLVLKGRYSNFDPESLGRNAVQYAGPNKVPFIVDQWGDPIQYNPGSPGKPPFATSNNL